MFYKINAKSKDKIKYTQIFWQEKNGLQTKNYPHYGTQDNNLRDQEQRQLQVGD